MVPTCKHRRWSRESGELAEHLVRDPLKFITRLIERHIFSKKIAVDFFMLSLLNRYLLEGKLNAKYLFVRGGLNALLNVHARVTA